MNKALLKSLILSAALAACPPGFLSRGASASGFEPDLEAIHKIALQTSAEQRQLRLQTTVDEIQNAASEARTFYSEVDGLGPRVRDIRRRAPQADRRPGRGRPRRDPSFEADLGRVIADVRDFLRKAESYKNEAERIEKSASADPALADPAKRLVNDAAVLKSLTTWLYTESTWTNTALASAGYGAEGPALESAAVAAKRAVEAAERSAMDLLEKVRRPPATDG